MANVPGRLPDGLDPADFGPAVPLGGGTPARSPMPRPAAGAVDSRLPEGLDPADFGPPVEQYQPIGLDVDGLRSSLSRSLGVQPDHAADIFKISRRTGLDVGTVERNLPEAKRADELARSAEGLDAFMQRNPRATTWLRDPANFGLAKDDLDALGGVEQAFMRNSQEPDELAQRTGLDWLAAAGGQTIAQSQRNLDLAELRTRQLFGDASPETQAQVDRLKSMEQAKPKTDGLAQDIYINTLDLLPQLLSQAKDRVFSGLQGGMGAGGAAALGSAMTGPAAPGAAAISVPTAFATGFGIAQAFGGAKNAFTMEAGGAYDEYKDIQGIDDGTAKVAAFLVGAANAGIEYAQFNLLLKTMPGGDTIKQMLTRQGMREALAVPTVRTALSNFARGYGKTLSLETAQEVLQEAITFLGGQAVRKDAGVEGQGWGEFAERMGDTAYQAGTGFALLTGSGHAMSLGQDANRARQAQRMGATFDEIGKLSGESKLNARLPEAYQDYVEYVRRETGGAVPEQIYVSAQRLAEAVVETGANGGAGSVQADAQVLAQFFQSIGVKPEDAQRMAALDQDVAIPFALYQSKIAATDIGQTLANDLRFTHDGMTRNEAAQFEKEFQGRVQSELAAQEQNRVQHDADLAQAIGEYKGELARVGIKGKDADTTLQLLSAGANVAAARWSAIKGESVTPAQWLRDMRGLQIRAVEQGQAQQKADLEQGIAHAGADLSKPEQVAEAARLWETMGTDSPYFKWWFGDSKVVGQDGKPLVVYHGTGADVYRFDPNKRGASSHQPDAREGYFFSSAPEAGSTYAEAYVYENQRARPNVLPTYLTMKNPLDVPAGGQTVLNAVKRAKAEGHDGVILRNDRDGGMVADTYIVFDPTQIKSVFNRGTFDASDPRILMQQGADRSAALEQYKKDPNVFWHGSPSGSLVGATNGIHVGTYRAAEEALNARIGIPAAGYWDGTRAYGQTLLAGKKRMKDLGEYPTGFNVDAPEEDYFPGDAKSRAKYSGGQEVDFASRPVISPVKIVGEMSNHRGKPMADFKANGQMSAMKKRGIAKRGYFYTNDGEDAGSISAVVPSREHLEEMPLPSSGQTLFQSAFHGSPYRFDKFTLDHIGSGEGAQAYGWGLYFAGNKEVSEWYRKNLTDRMWQTADGQTLPHGEAFEKIRKAVAAVGGDSHSSSVIADNIMQTLESSKSAKSAAKKFELPGGVYGPAYKAGMDEALRLDMKRAKGQLYEVTIPDDDTMLDWDKPLSEQPEGVKKALAPLLEKLRAGAEEQNPAYRTLPDVLRRIEDGTATGEAIYAWAGSDPKRASEYLKSIGIPGLRYLDGTSRGKGEGHHNYVVFDDAQIAIDKTYFQAIPQGARGSISFTNRGTFIDLFKGAANRSTLPHEFAHLFVNDMQAMVATGKAPESVVRDLAALQSFAGDLLTVEAQEKLAKAFEVYLREGKAPSPELRTTFQTFRAWLTAIYRDIRTLLGPGDLNDELRGVFDRMLASEDEIAQAEAYYGARDALEKVAADMLTDAEKKRITELRGASHAAALEKRTQRYVSAYLKALGGKAEFERQASEEVDARAIYANVKDIAENGGLPRAALDELVGQEQAQALFLKFPGLVSAREASLFGAHDLDLIAAAHGYQSADAMVADFQKAMTRGEAARNLAAEKMQAEEARLRESLANETVPGDEDVHSDETLERLTTEARALERKIRNDAGAKTAVSSPINAAASREVARAVLETMTVTNARDYSRFAAAERRAGLEVAQAVKAQDWTKALGAKQREAINHALVLEAVKLREEVTKELAFARRIGNSKSMRFEAKEQALSVIQAYGLGTEKMAPERPGELVDLAGYLKAALEEEMFNPFDAFPDWLLRKEKAGKYRALTVADFREVAYLMRTLADVGGSAAIHMATEDVSYEAKAAELAGVVRNSGNVAAKHDEGTKQQKAVHIFRSLMSTMQQQLDMFRKADGYVNLGPENSHLVGPNQELFERIQKSTARMLGMLQGHEPAMKEIAKVRQAFVDSFRKAYGERVAEVNGVAVPQIMQDNERYTWTAERIWTIARNIGNGGNRRCLIEGLGLEWSSIQQLLRVLTKDELLAVQREGKIIGSHYAEADKTFRQVYHRPMAQRIEYQPMTIQAADGPVQLDGWYFPIKPDAKLNQRAGDREGADIMKADASASAFPPNPRKSFTNARTGAAVPVALSFDVFERGIAEQTRFIAMAPILKDADRVFRQEEYRRAYTDAFGREAYDEIRPWLKNIATPGMEQVDAYDDILSKARRGATAYILIGNLKSALKQELGHLPAMKEMGAAWALRGMKALAVDGDMTVEAINAMDPRMKNREKGFDTEQRELLAKARNETVKLAFGKIDTHVTEHDVLKFGMTLQRLFDRHTTYSVWAGAYLKGRDGLNMSEQESIDYAYRMVERTQVTNTDAAMNAIQRGKSWVRLFSMFMSEALPKGSRIRVDFNAFKNGKIGAGQYARAVFYELIGPVLFNVVGLNLLASVAPDEPKEYFWAFWNELFGVFPLLGGVSGYFLYGSGPAESAAFTGMEVQLKAAQKSFNLAQDFEDESKQAALFKALIDVAAYKYKVGNVRRFYETAAEAFEDMADGETKNPFRLVIRKPKGHE